MSSSSLDIQIGYSVDDFDREAWDRLSGGRPFTSYRWYRFGEAVLNNGRPVYIVLSQRGEPVARATFWLDMQEPLPVDSAPVRRLLEATLRRWPLMVCRSPLLVAVSGLILPDPPLRDAALAALVEAAQEEARRHGVSFLLFDHLEPHETQYGWPAAYMPVSFSEPGTRLVIAWPDFESYLQRLSKGARKDYRRHRNRAADLGIVIQHHPTVTTALDTAMTLIRNVGARHNDPPNAWARRALENAGMVDATWLTAEIGDDLVGCGLLLGDEAAQFLMLLGLTCNVQYAYFQLVYAAIRCAIEKGARFLRGGREAYAIKQRLGFVMESNNHVMFAGRSPLLGRLGRWLAAGAGAVG